MPIIIACKECDTPYDEEISSLDFAAHNCDDRSNSFCSFKCWLKWYIAYIDDMDYS